MSNSEDDAKEDTPLLGAECHRNQELEIRSLEDGPYRPEQTDPEPESKSTLYLFLLCLGLGGLQMAWATELSYGSPYLLSLGMPKSLLAMVWIAGPLSGVLVQPFIGGLSDNCRISWGRRRPFMLAGSAATVISLLALAWSPEVVSRTLAIFNSEVTEGKKSNIIIGSAIAWIYILDFSVNTLQASIRAFIVDNAPAHQQDQANAWASRIVGFGNILGYLTGYINLPLLLPYLGDTQFKVLCAVSCILLVMTVSLSCYSISELDPRLRWPSASDGHRSTLAILRDCLSSYTRLSPQTQLVCVTQFFNWMGWFPFLFYITTYIGQLYLNPLFERNPNLSRPDINKAWEEATRFGAFALLIFAISSFAANSLLPLLIRPNAPPPRVGDDHTQISRLNHLLASFYIPNFTIRRAWFFSQLLFAACMFSTFFITHAVAAAAMTGIVGLSWAMTLWAPFALIATDISKRDALRRAQEAPVNDISPSTRDDSTTEEDAEASTAVATEEESATADIQAGVVLGLHNVAISAPQIIATVVSSVIFEVAQRDRGAAGDTSLGWVLKFGGLAALVAAWRTLKIKEEGE